MTRYLSHHKKNGYECQMCDRRHHNCAEAKETESVGLDPGPRFDREKKEHVKKGDVSDLRGGVNADKGAEMVRTH